MIEKGRNRMFDLPFEALSDAEAKALLEKIAHDLLPVKMPADKTEISVCALPFYEEHKLYSLQDTTLPEPNTRYILYKDGDLTIMNWTNEPIYEVNEKAPIKLDRKTLPIYAKFFFHFVRGQLGRFIIVEKSEDVRWLDNATDEEKAKVAESLKPVKYQNIGRDNLFTLASTVVFKNALFKTDIKIAPYELEAFDKEAGMPEQFTIGQMKLTNEELLLEDLNIPVDEPPGEFG